MLPVANKLPYAIANRELGDATRGLEPIDSSGCYRFNPTKITFKDVETYINSIYHDTNEYYSSAMDILASYVRGHKLIYMEAESFCQRRLSLFMVPSIFLSATASVLSVTLKEYSWGGTVLASIKCNSIFSSGYSELS